MKISRVGYTLMASALIVAALFAASHPTPARAVPCEYCSVWESTGVILATHAPNAFVAHTATECDLSVPAGACSWDERMLILKYVPTIREWVRVSDTVEHVGGYCGGGTNYHAKTYPVGTGRHRAELDVRNVYGIVIDSYTYELVF